MGCRSLIQKISYGKEIESIYESTYLINNFQPTVPTKKL